MGAFKGTGLRNAQVFEKGVYLQPGNFKLQITTCLTKKTLQSGNAFIAEFKVLESSDPQAHPVGSKATWYQGIDNILVAYPSLKTFVYSVLGFSYPRDKEKCLAEVDPVIEDLLDEAIDKGAFNGKTVEVQTYLKKKEGKQDFTVHVWLPDEGKKAA